MIKKRKKIWVCLACGKRSNDQMGENPVDMGWDVSCMLNAYEAFEDQLVIENNRVKEIKNIRIKGKKKK